MSHSFIVPLGPTTAVRHQMGKKFNPNREFLFFDPLMTSFRSVIDVIKADDIRQIVNKETFNIDEITAARVTISFKGTDCLKNAVDIRPTSAGADTRAFFGKMYGRYERLMFYIKQDQYKLTFTFAGAISNDEAQEFMDAVWAHYSDGKVRLVSLAGDEDQLDTGIARFSRIRFATVREPADEIESYSLEHYDWAHVWATIDGLDVIDIEAEKAEREAKATALKEEKAAAATDNSGGATVVEDTIQLV
jgi:hypothetical protein